MGTAADRDKVGIDLKGSQSLHTGGLWPLTVFPFPDSSRV